MKMGRKRKAVCTQGDGSVQAQPVAIGYARVSTEEQAREGVSLDAQREKIHAYCSLTNLRLDRVIVEEGVSASISLAARPAGAELVEAIARRRAGHVVALKLDRLFRDAADALNQTRAWDNLGAALHLIDVGGQAINTSSPMGRFFLTMMAGFAELERNLIGDRTRTAMQHMKTERQVYGPAPVGWRVAGDDLVSDVHEQAIVAVLRAWRAEGWTLREMAAALNAGNVATKRGGARWHASTIQSVLGNGIHDQPRTA